MFTNLMARLLEQVGGPFSFLNITSCLQHTPKPVLSRKQEAILFLLTLSSSNVRRAPTISMPTLVNPPSLKTQTRLASSDSLAPQEGKIFSKAEALRDFRIQKGDWSSLDIDRLLYLLH